MTSSSDSPTDSEEEAESGGASASEDSQVADAAGAGSDSADAQAQAAAGGGSQEPTQGQPGGAGAPGGTGSPAGLDEELSESLEVFDGEMQRQITVLASASPPPESDLDEMGEASGGTDSGEAEEAGAASGMDQTGEGPGLILVADPSELPPAAGEAPEQQGAATSGAITDGEMPGQRSSREGSVNVAMVSSRVPPDVGDGSDDDVVARQIREAAMNEDDPVLREKLWEEYRNYKKSIR
ncbi:MAG: hypothetical protein R3200_13185 [Xanthomonadales bacterium]|nr:hypothetical protein [Xanthomonadales bacterium]